MKGIGTPWIYFTKSQIIFQVFLYIFYKSFILLPIFIQQFVTRPHHFYTLK